MMKRLINLLKYAGLDKKSYDELIQDINEDNRIGLYRYTAISAVMFMVLAVSAYLSNNFATINTITYLVCGICSAVFFFVSRMDINRKSNMIVLILIYLFMFMLYAFSFVITSMHPDKPAVTAIVLLLTIPLLFADRPIRMVCMTIFVVFIFCELSYITKPADVSVTDIWNALTFGVVAIMAETLLMRVKIRNLYQEKQISYLSQVDLLTEVKNRNSYEKYMQSIEEQGNSNVCCVYADVNGLHEMNNTKGHKAGDEMLQFVSSKMKDEFGFDKTFRVGGDEFVGFCEKLAQKEIEAKINRIINRCKENGYYVSVGYANLETSVESMIQAAEEKMYETKR